MSTSSQLAKALLAEFVIEFRAGANDATEQQVADFLEREIYRRCDKKVTALMPKVVYAYYNDRKLRFSFDLQEAHGNADGFVWDNPRVRKVGIIYPSP